MVKLNLGAGERKRLNCINIDINPNHEPDLVRDITRGLPFHDEEVDEIWAEHILEHFDTEDFVFIMNECHRVLNKEGILHIRSPHINHPTAFIDPGHKRFFIENSFNLFCEIGPNVADAGIKGHFGYLNIKVDDGELQVDLKKWSE